MTHVSRLIAAAVLAVTLAMPVAAVTPAHADLCTACDAHPMAAAHVTPSASIGCLENCGEWVR
jgi:hypothetical protein